MLLKTTGGDSFRLLRSDPSTGTHSMHVCLFHGWTSSCNLTKNHQVKLRIRANRAAHFALSSSEQLHRFQVFLLLVVLGFFYDFLTVVPWKWHKQEQKGCTLQCALPKWHYWLLPAALQDNSSASRRRTQDFWCWRPRYLNVCAGMVWSKSPMPYAIQSHTISHRLSPQVSPAGRGAEKTGCALSSRASETPSPEQGAGKTQGREESGFAPVRSVVIQSLLWSHLCTQYSDTGASGHPWWRQKYFLQHRFRSLLQSQLWAVAFSFYFNLKKVLEHHCYSSMVRCWMDTSITEPRYSQNNI